MKRISETTSKFLKLVENERQTIRNQKGDVLQKVIDQDLRERLLRASKEDSDSFIWYDSTSWIIWMENEDGDEDGDEGGELLPFFMTDDVWESNSHYWVSNEDVDAIGLISKSNATLLAS
jgi:hypothetical protein